MRRPSSSIDPSQGRASRAALVVLALAGAGVAALALELRHALPPFALVAGFLFAVLVFLSRRLRRGKVFLYNAAFVFLALAIAELAFFFLLDRNGRTVSDGTYTQRHFTPLPELGYGSLREKRVTTSRLLASGKVLYDVTYTIDDDGLRTTPRGYSTPQALFFGCSYTFGEGVQDDETLPALFGAGTGISAVNFGFHGYGPHQMLRALELDLPRAFGHGSATVALYTAHPTHIDRANGRSAWDQQGPKYELTDGTLQYRGPFSQTPWLLDKLLSHSKLASAVRGRLGALATDETRDRETFLAIVRESGRLVQTNYGAQFYVLLWDVGPTLSPLERDRARWLKREAPRAGLRLIALSDEAPQLGEPRFYIPVDGHPTAAAYAEAARVLTATIARRPAPTDVARTPD